MTAPAPVALFAFDRPRHLDRTLASLAACDMAGDTHLHVFADGPPPGATESRLERIARVRERLETIRGFAAVTVTLREENLGLYRSIIAGVDEVLARRDRVVVVEDDLLLARAFLGYVNEALERYRRRREVTSVSGYGYDLPGPDRVPSAFFLRTFSCLGWATWADRWGSMTFGTGDLPARIRQRPLGRFRFDVLGTMDRFRSLQANDRRGGRRSWAIEFDANQFLAGGRQLFPPRSLVRHLGYDGSGTNTGAENPWRDPDFDPHAPRPVLPDDTRVRWADQLSLATFFLSTRTRMYLSRRLGGAET